jgi:hypothetical protein
MSPALRLLPEGAETDQVTVVLAVPKLLAVAVNCCCVPMTAEAGATVMEGVGGGGAEEFPQPEIIRHAAEIIARVAGRSKSFISLPPAGISFFGTGPGNCIAS